MDRQAVNSPQNLILLLLLGLVALAGMGFANYRFTVNNPGGNDFLVHYIGTRSFLIEGISPYSDTVAGRIQKAAYGHSAQEGEHELRVAYPFYSTLVFSPFALVADYPLARAIWMTVLEITLFASAFLSLRLTEWEPSWGVNVFYFLFSVAWYHAVRGLINGNAIVLINFFLIAFFYALKKEQDRIAGVALALATIKPHVVLMLVVFVIFWSVSNRRMRLIYWFLGTLLVLVAGGMIFIPNWIYQNLWEVLRFPSYNPVLSLGELLGQWMPGIQRQIRWGLVLFLGTLVIYEWWRARKGHYFHFLWAACLTLSVSQWIGIPTDPGNFVILFPALVLVISFCDKRWKRFGSIIVVGFLLSIFIGLWALFLGTLEHAYQPLQSPIMFIPLPGIVILGLYWVRWWVLKPTRHVLEY